MEVGIQYLSRYFTISSIWIKNKQKHTDQSRI